MLLVRSRLQKRNLRERRTNTFIDGLGREVYFRGWNFSGESKNPKTGFKPFATLEEAEAGLEVLKEYTGSNVIRFLVSWEGNHPAVDSIDYAYLDSITQQIKAAIDLEMYIMLDWHQDLFSRHIPDGANGAPKWIVDGMDLPEGGCGKPCLIWVTELFH